jgi:hypothetical protein
MNVIYRLDTESARAFLSQFVTLPQLRFRASECEGGGYAP